MKNLIQLCIKMIKMSKDITKINLFIGVLPPEVYKLEGRISYLSFPETHRHPKDVYVKIMNRIKALKEDEKLIILTYSSEVISMINAFIGVLFEFDELTAMEGTLITPTESWTDLKYENIPCISFGSLGDFLDELSDYSMRGIKISKMLNEIMDKDDEVFKALSKDD